MPTYEYECRACGHTFDVFQSMSADALTICPACDKKQLRRLIGGGAGIIFKGSGFYVNDSRSKSSSATGKPARETADGASKPSEAATATAEKPDSSKNGASGGASGNSSAGKGAAAAS